MSTRRLTDSIWLIDTGSAYDSHVYLIDGGSAAALVDCGTGLATGQLLARIGETDCADRLTHLFLTHYHADHAGGAAGIRDLRDVRILASAETAAVLRVADEDAAQVKRAREAGVYPGDYHYRRCHVDEVLEHEAAWTLGKLSITAYSSPGHCDGHMCYLIDDGKRSALCSGDAIFHGGRISVQPIPDCNPYLYAQTLHELSSLPVDLLLPGHGEVTLDAGSEHIARAAAVFRRLQMPSNIAAGPPSS